MKLELFKPGAPVLMSELRQLVRSKDSDQRKAGVDFVYALKTMRAQQRLLATRQVSSSLCAQHRLLLQPSRTSVWVRETSQHSLYLTHIPPTSNSSQTVVRALIACNGAEPEHDRVRRAAERHSQM